MSKCLVIQHVEPEGPFAIANALLAQGIEIDLRRVFLGDPLPHDLAGIDGVVVMGGPMSVISDVGFATRRRELDLLRSALAMEVPTLGVCLGAQLLARAGGSKVFSGSRGPEIGFASVQLEDDAMSDPLLMGLARDQLVLHWHGDTFDLPHGSKHLSSNGVYENQAFRLGNAAWGFQFHFEVDDVAVKGFVEAFTDELQSAGIASSDILAATPLALEVMVPLQTQITTRFAQFVRDN